MAADEEDLKSSLSVYSLTSFTFLYSGIIGILTIFPFLVRWATSFPRYTTPFRSFKAGFLIIASNGEPSTIRKFSVTIRSSNATGTGVRSPKTAYLTHCDGYALVGILFYDLKTAVERLGEYVGHGTKVYQFVYLASIDLEFGNFQESASTKTLRSQDFYLLSWTDCEEAAVLLLSFHVVYSQNLP